MTTDKVVNVKLTKTVKFNGKYEKPGTVIKVPIRTAKYLSKKAINAAIVMEGSESVSYKTIADPRSEAIDNLLEIEGMTEQFAEDLYALGIRSIEDVQSASIDDLTPVKNIGEKTAQELIEAAEAIELVD